MDSLSVILRYISFIISYSMTTSAMEYPKSRKEALEGGIKRYHGKPCRNCGETLKRATQGDCVACHKVSQRKYMKQYMHTSQFVAAQKEYKKSPNGYAIKKSHRIVERVGHRGVLVSWANPAAITNIYDKARKLGMEVDHIIPLKSPLVCGLHVENNLQMLTKEENFSKRNKFDPMTFEA